MSIDVVRNRTSTGYFVAGDEQQVARWEFRWSGCDNAHDHERGMLQFGKSFNNEFHIKVLNAVRLAPNSAAWWGYF
ncbi:hypothetical protein ACQPYK_17420 [Streptosporangium sp. CA-135522]|uniref:hypothetical protein n=1 Tax=Streptosporangium sp. CA-135522 TaxID=3240072 RepID=UPI003D8F1D12